jgi:hypothetical protein
MPVMIEPVDHPESFSDPLISMEVDGTITRGMVRPSFALSVFELLESVLLSFNLYGYTEETNMEVLYCMEQLRLV